MLAQVFKGRDIPWYIVAHSELDGFGYNSELDQPIDRKPGSITAHMSMTEWDELHTEDAVPAKLRALMAARGFEFTEGEITVAEGP